MNKRGFLLIGIVAFFISVFAFNFSDMTQSNFNNGTYLNTSYNGSAVILVGNNLTGTFTSRIFDAISVSRWDNFSFNFNEQNKSYLFTVDLSGAVFLSNDLSLTWNKKSSGYGRTTDGQDIFSDNSSIYVLSNTNKEVWKSTNNGISWSVVNDTFSSNNLFAGVSDWNENLFVSAGTATGFIFKSFDSGRTWNQLSNISLGTSITTKGMAVNRSNALFLVSGAGKVYSSTNFGVTWNLINSSYGRTTDAIDMFSDNLNNLYILSNTNKEVWKSTNNGISWSVVNDTFSSNNLFAGVSDYNGNVYVVDNNGAVYKSSNNGVTWNFISDFNGASISNSIGLTSMIKTSDISFQVRNCSLSNCGDGVWQSVNLSNINLTGRYFQYQAYFSTLDSSIVPQLFNVSFDYSVLDNLAPNISIISPINKNYSTSNILVNISSSDASGISSIWFFNGSANVSYTLPVLYIFPQGSNTLIAYANDSFGNLNSTSVSFIVDTIGPLVNIISPESKIYGVNTSLLLNFSVSDATTSVNSCKYSLDGNSNISVLNCQNTLFNTSNGAHTIFVYANDSLGNLGYSTVNFSINTQLAVSLERPLNNQWVKNNIVSFNYTVNTFSTVNNCSLFLNSSGVFGFNKTNESAINISGGINSFSLDLADGSYIWNVFCYGTFSDFALANYSVNIDTINPALEILYPLNNTLINQNVSIALNYTASDLNLQSCKYSFNNGITNNSLSCNNGFNSINFEYLNGTYNFTLYANDSANNLNSYVIYNLTIQKDDVSPNLTINEPIGSKSSKTEISLQFSALDDVDSLGDLTCSFNVTYTNGLLALSETLISQCLSTQFDVPTSSSDYILYLSARDRSGNVNVRNSTFSVIGTTTVVVNSGSSGSGVGGGGGSSGNVSKSRGINDLSVGALSGLIVNPGDNKKISWSVKNIGTNFLNDCKVLGSGKYASWISSNENKKLGAGEAVNFVFILNIPTDAKSDKYDIKVNVSCMELTKSTNFIAEIIEKKLEFRLIEAKRDKTDRLDVRYYLEELSGINQDVEIQFLLFDLDNKKISELTDKKSINANSNQNFEVFIPIANDLNGNFNLLININSKVYSSFVQENIVLSAPVSGFAIFSIEQFGSEIAIIIVIALFSAFAIFMIIRILRLRKSVKKFKKYSVS